MKSSKFLSLFARFFVLLMLLGIVFSLIDSGNLSAIVYISLISMVTALIMAAMTIRVRATDPQDVSRIFRLNFALWLPYWIAKLVFIKLHDLTELSILKLLLLLGIAVLGAFFFAKMMTILPKKVAEA